MSKCIHEKNPYICKLCGGLGICEHGKQKRYCKTCGGSAFCEHGKQKTRCKTCGGSALCEHGKQKSRCKTCGGSALCEHGKYKTHCKTCGGSSICEHGKYKTQCKTCGGSAFCEHGIQKSYCKTCGGSAFCEHGIQKSTCETCGGSAICEHGKYKTRCKTCGGSQLCKNDGCETNKNLKYDGYCMPCFFNNPENIDKPQIRNYKTKEKEVVDYVKNVFSEYPWIHDKRVKGGCSLRRPDLLLNCETHIIIIEIDENKHCKYDRACEHKRIMEISQDLQYKPIVFIRFNPDDYVNENGKSIKSCWKLNKLGVLEIQPSKKEEWDQRLETLNQNIQYWIENSTEKTIEIIELFY